LDRLLALGFELQHKAAALLYCSKRKSRSSQLAQLYSPKAQGRLEWWQRNLHPPDSM
jgi:hypothetical protein